MVRKGHRLVGVVIALSSYQVDELHILIVGRHGHRGNMSGLASLGGVPVKKEETENLIAVSIFRGANIASFLLSQLLGDLTDGLKLPLHRGWGSAKNQGLGPLSVDRSRRAFRKCDWLLSTGAILVFV